MVNDICRLSASVRDEPQPWVITGCHEHRVLKHAQAPSMSHLIKSDQGSSRAIKWSSWSQSWPMTKFTHRIVCSFSHWTIYCFDQRLCRARKYLATVLAPESEPTGAGFCCDNDDEDDTETKSKSFFALLDCVKTNSQTIATASLCIAFPAWPMMAVREFTCADDPSSIENEETSVPKLSSRSVGMPCMCRHSLGVSQRQWVSDLSPDLLQRATATHVGLAMLSINCKDIAEPNVHYDLLLAPALCISQNKCVLACDNLIFCYLAPSTHKAKSLSSSNISAPQYIYNHAKKYSTVGLVLNIGNKISSSSSSPSSTSSSSSSCATCIQSNYWPAPEWTCIPCETDPNTT